MVFEKPLRIGKTERYEIAGANLTAWLDGEVLLSATVEPDTTKATLSGSVDFNDGLIGFYLVGVASGGCNVHINYSTATRSDCYTAIIIVSPC
jgi:hypothetical protein